MEENLGVGGDSVILSHGGITAVVETEGIVLKGDAVQTLPENGSGRPPTKEES